MGMTDKQRKAYEMYQRGMTYSEIAKELNSHSEAVRGLIRRAKLWENEPTGVKEGVPYDTPARVMWTKELPDGRVVRSMMHVNDPNEITFEEAVDAIKDGLRCDAPPPKPDNVSFTNHQIILFPVADLHVGLLTDAEEVGEDWDSKIVTSTFIQKFSMLVDNAPTAEYAVIGQLGDLTHVDDQRNVTPGSQNQLDADTRYYKILRRAVALMKMAIELLRKKYKKVIYRGCRGNHDKHAHHAVTLGLSEYYAKASDVSVETSAEEFWIHEYGNNMILLHHGDMAKPERLVTFAAAEWPDVWGRTKYRVAFSGHIHHESVKEVAGMKFESVGTIIPRDAWHKASGYWASRYLTAVLFHRTLGEIARTRVTY